MIWRYLLAIVLSIVLVVGFQLWQAAKRQDPAGVEAPADAPPGDAVKGADMRADAGAGKGDGAVAGKGDGAVAGKDAAAKAVDAADGATGKADSAPQADDVGKGDDAGKSDDAVAADAAGKADDPAADEADTPPAPQRTPSWKVEWDASGSAVVAVTPVDFGKPVINGGDCFRLGLFAGSRADGATATIVDAWESQQPEAGPKAPDRVDVATPGGPFAGLEIRRSVWVPHEKAVRQQRRRMSVVFAFRNTGDQPLEFAYEVAGPGGVVSSVGDGSDLAFGAGTWSVADPAVPAVVSARPASSVEDPWVVPGAAAWIGVANRDAIVAAYCWTANYGHGASVEELRGSVERAGGVSVPRTALATRSIQLAAGARTSGEFRLFAGPRDATVLEGFSRLDFADFDRRVSRLVNRRTVRLSDALEVEIDTKSGSIVDARLLGYYEEAGDDPGRERYRLLLDAGGVGLFGLAQVVLNEGGRQVSAHGGWQSGWSYSEKDGPDGTVTIVLEKTIGAITVRKTITPVAAVPGLTPPGPDLTAGQLLVATLTISNGSEGDRAFLHRFYGPTAVRTAALRGAGSDLAFSYAARVNNNVVPEIKWYSDLDEQGKIWESPSNHRQKVLWESVSSSYFTSVMMPRTTGDGEGISAPVDDVFVEKIAAVDEAQEDPYETLRSGFRTQATIPARGELTYSYLAYLGPREGEFINSNESIGLENVNDYGMFTFFINLFMGLIAFLNKLALGSWGVAIILLTLVVKLCLHPINRKSQRSMMRFQKKFQKIQPQMKALQEKYGSDRMKYSQAVQGLWKEHGVNPGQQMLGCLVIFLQLPIWIGLFRTLDYEIGLRHASFLYIGDLTQPDMLFPLLRDYQLPLIGTMFAYFNILPILYVILTVVNQRLQPRPADPQMQSQHRMMTFMMVAFGFIFYNFPAGFMLYIMTSAALGIVESKLIKAQLKKEEATWGDGPSPAAAGTSGGPAPTSSGPMYGSSKKSDKKGKGKGKKR